MGAQPGDVHLGDTEPLADLHLGHAAAKVHQQDLLLTRGQLAPVRGDGLHAEHVRTCQRLSRKCRLSSPLMHGRAYVARLQPAAGSKLPIALSKPTYPTCIRSSAGSGLLRYRRTQDHTRLWWRLTSSSHAAVRRAGLRRHPDNV